ncbi:Phosphatidylinositol-specific phospholipase C X domain, partial [Trinorchestia longiramus]
MKDGSSLIKVRSSGRQYHRYFRLLDDLSAIHWTPSSKKVAKAQIAIDQIHEIRTGRNCESLRHQPYPLRYPEDRIFSILYGPDYQSLDLIAYTPEEASVWVTGLNALIGDAASPDAPDADMVPLRDRWLQEMFEQACGPHTTSMDQDACVRLIQRLDPNVETERVLHKIQEYDVCKPEKSRGRLSAAEFISSFKELATRHEISCLLIRFANKDYLTLEDLHVFLEGEQRMSGLTVDQVREVIELYEPSSEARSCHQLHIDGFTKYLLSEDCDIFDPRHRTVSQDMTLPLTHYFISSSHNTYLLEDQVKGPCSVDGYIRVLTCGCRCVKVDVHDGPTEPLVYNGLAHTSFVPFREVVEAIATFSFDFSVYPVIVHLENHCSVPQQRLMVDLLTTILGPLLYQPPGLSGPPVSSLSPEELKNKVLLKVQVSEGEVTDEDEGQSEDRERDGRQRGHGGKRNMKLCSELSKLIALTRDDGSERASKDCQNVSEAVAGRFCHGSAEDLVSLNKRMLTRVYPNTSREDSSNYDPQDFWNTGCQLVSLNFQTPGQMMDVYEGKFRSNGGCGYVIKPAVMREHISVFSAISKEPIPGVTPQLLRIKVISAQSLPKPRGSTASKASFLDPYVVIQVLGIPADRKEFQTRTVKNNSRFPVFEESFDIELLLPEVPAIKRSPPGPLPTHLQRLETALDHLLQEIEAFLSTVKADQQELKKCLQPALSLYDRLDSLLLSSGVKGKKANKSRENFAWNVRIIRGQVDKLSAAKERCTVALGQLESTRTTLT